MTLLKPTFAFLALGLLLSPAAHADTFAHYAITSTSVEWFEDIHGTIQDEFGSDAALADWTDLVASFSGQAAAFADAVGLPSGGSVWCRLDGEEFYDTARRYFVRRADGLVPDGFLIHGSLDSDTLLLGAYFNGRPILVRLGDSVPAETSTWSGVKRLFR